MQGFDDKETEIVDNALLLIQSIRAALAGGTKHYRKSDSALLTTEKDIVQALYDEGEIIIEPKKKGGE